MTSPSFFPRYAAQQILDALQDTPVVLIHGPRQCGKTTLARMVGKTHAYAYFTFDDETLLAAAHADPIGFVANLPQRVILDEIQRVPGLFLALKQAVDRDRKPGRFLLTGSTNILLLPQLADSLAGRIEVVRLHPLSQVEVTGHPPGFFDHLFQGKFPPRCQERLGKELIERVVAGGYPAALTRKMAHRRAAWYREYIEALIQRDVRQLARINSLATLPRLLAGAAGQTARLFNLSTLASPFELSRPTIHEYLTLLERVFLLESLPPWHSNRLSRLVKTSKLHLGDTGIACSLLGLDSQALAEDRATFGQLLETFVFQELRKQAGWLKEEIRFYHFRDRDGSEIDLVVERGSREVAGIEVKAAASVTDHDFLALRKLAKHLGPRFKAGIVLYDGETPASFGTPFLACPISTLWGKP